MLCLLNKQTSYKRFGSGRWSEKNSTCERVLEVIPTAAEYRKANESFDFLDTCHTNKSLVRNPSLYNFSFRIRQLDQQLDNVQLTEQKVLRDIIKVYDLLDWLSPVTLNLEHIMQINLGTNFGCDDKLPSDNLESYKLWQVQTTCSSSDKNQADTNSCIIFFVMLPRSGTLLASPS